MMISFKEAQKELRNHAKRLDTEECRSLEACSRVAAEPLTARYSIPHFANSAMDGFCLKLNSAAGEGAVYKVAERIAAGDPPRKDSLSSESCYEIMTGAVIPEGCDTVVRLEDVKIIEGDRSAPQKIRLNKPPQMGENIRKAGEDFQETDLLVNARERIGPQHLAILSSHGISKLRVFRKPKVALLCTGQEVVDDLSQELRPGQLYNSNRALLSSALSQWGLQLDYFGKIDDNMQAFKQKLSEVSQGGYDLVVTTGAVSMGQYDFIRPALESLGAQVLFHKVAIRPGKPILFAKLEGMGFLGLPGNPVSAFVGMRFFVEEYLRGMFGIPAEQASLAKLETSFEKKASLFYFLKARTFWRENELCLRILKGQQSFMLSPLLEAKAWAALPDQTSGFQEGDLVEVYPLFSEGSL